MSAELTRWKKVSVLLDCLDQDTVDQILASLSAEEIAQLQRATHFAGNVSHSERQEILREFMEIEGLAQADEVSGIEIDASLAELLAYPAALDPTRQHTTPDDGPAVDFLSQLTARQIALRLERESSQVAAVVLSQVPPVKAADILHALPPELRDSAIQRLVVIDNQDPMVLDAIRAVLEQEFPQQLPHGRRSSSLGWDATRAIVQASPPTLRRELRHNFSGRPDILGSGAEHERDPPELPSPTTPKWVPPWLQLFAEQQNPWYFT